MKVDSKVARLSSAASSAAKRSRPNCDIFCIAETLESLESNGLNCKKVKGNVSLQLVFTRVFLIWYLTGYGQLPISFSS